MHFEAFASQYTLPIWLPLLAAIIAGLLSYINRSVRHFFTVLALLVNLVLSLGLLLRVLSGIGEIAPAETFGSIDIAGMQTAVVLRVTVDPAGAFIMLITALVVWAATAAFRPVFDRGLSYPLVLTAVGLLNGAVLSDTLVMLICFLAPLPGVLAGLVLFEEQEPLPQIGIAPLPAVQPQPGKWQRLRSLHLPIETADAAGLRLVIFLGTGVALLLFAALAGGELQNKHLLLANLPPERAAFVILSILLALLAWSAAFPWHSWLVNAQGRTAAPVAACLSGAAISMGLLWLVRIFGGLDYGLLLVDFPLPELYRTQLLQFLLDWRFLIAASGVLTALGAAAGALLDRRSGHIMAYIGLSQIGMAVLALGSGLTGGQLSMPAYMTVIMAIAGQALATTLLFLVVSAVAFRIYEAEIHKARPLVADLPLTLVAAVVAVLSVAGIPPLLGFEPHWMVYQLLLQSSNSDIRLLLLPALVAHVLLSAALIRFLFGLFMIEQTNLLAPFYAWLYHRSNLQPVAQPAIATVIQPVTGVRSPALARTLPETSSDGLEIDSSAHVVPDVPVYGDVSNSGITDDNGNIPNDTGSQAQEISGTDHLQQPELEQKQLEQHVSPASPVSVVPVESRETNVMADQVKNDTNRPPIQTLDGEDTQTLGSAANTSLALPDARFHHERIDLLVPMAVLAVILIVLGIAPQLIAAPLTIVLQGSGNLESSWGWGWTTFAFAGAGYALLAGILVMLGILAGTLLALLRPLLESFAHNPIYRNTGFAFRALTWLLASGWLDLYRLARLIVMAVAGIIANILDSTLGRATR